MIYFNQELLKLENRDRSNVIFVTLLEMETRQLIQYYGNIPEIFEPAKRKVLYAAMIQEKQRKCKHRKVMAIQDYLSL